MSFSFLDFVIQMDLMFDEMLVACTGFNRDQLEKMSQKRRDKYLNMFMNSFNREMKS